MTKKTESEKKSADKVNKAAREDYAKVVKQYPNREVVGKSYGVTDDQAPESDKDTLPLNDDTNANEAGDEAKAQLEEELSDKGNNIVARVVTWTGDYVKVKFLRDNKPFAQYKAKKGSKAGAKAHLKDALYTEKKISS